MTNSISISKYVKVLICFLFLLFILEFSTGNRSVLAQARDSEQRLPQSIIIKSGSLIADETWTSDNIYVIRDYLIVNPGVILTIEANTIIKVDQSGPQPNKSLDVNGTLNLLGSFGSEVIFTSYRDDTYGGDTNEDGNNTIPAPGDWLGIYLHNSSTTFQYALVRYSSNGLAVWNDQSADIQPLISHNIFEQNIHGISLFVTNDKNITSLIQDNVFTHNEFGLFTCQSSCTSGSTGSILPVVQDNNFNNNSLLPIYLNGPAFPTYSGNSFIGFPTPDQRLGIGLGGQINYNGDWSIVNSAADGSGINMPYVVLEHTIINPVTTIIVPPSTIIKFDLSKYLDVQGTLVLQSLSSDTVITFTSLRDDVGGDTNGDGSDTEPEPGDWLGFYIENSSTTVQYVTVKIQSKWTRCIECNF